MTNAAVQTTHPADETLAAFIDGRLDPEARQPVIEHIAECAECRDVLNTADELAMDEGRLAPVVPFWKSWLIPAASLAAAASIGYVVFTGPIGDRYMAKRRVEALETAAAGLKERPIAARVSVDMPYKQHPNPRGAETQEIPGEHKVLSVAADIQEAVRKHPTATNLHHLGVALLLMGEQRYRGEAVQSLEEALKQETGQTDIALAVRASKNAALLNDLAAGYRAANDERAAAVIDYAWRLEKSPTIAWTRATILWTDDAWKDYLALDGTSQWAEEARLNLTYIEGN